MIFIGALLSAGIYWAWVWFGLLAIGLIFKGQFFYDNQYWIMFVASFIVGAFTVLAGNLFFKTKPAELRKCNVRSNIVLGAVNSFYFGWLLWRSSLPEPSTSKAVETFFVYPVLIVFISVVLAALFKPKTSSQEN